MVEGLADIAFGNLTVTAERLKTGAVVSPASIRTGVEIVTAEKIGIETTTYVRNIDKYYVAYRLMLDAHDVADKARQQVAPGKG